MFYIIIRNRSVVTIDYLCRIIFMRCNENV